ncbi:hypothetical protein BSIN_2457 [Burkholderia singularis]|uniref:Uncharacterized protein n=1 Tax=Burkholderia singularis TaxID=1503053 RepID=A0A238H1X9_9BURK|nr:hypothetical protein BSIN_2457 [Burkholderia singularis]
MEPVILTDDLPQARPQRAAWRGFRQADAGCDSGPRAGLL